MKVKDADSLVREIEMVQDRLRIERNRIQKIQAATEKLGKVIAILARPEGGSS